MSKNLKIAREISWLSFNARVLQEANDPSLPLKQRIRFLGIYSNNLDEFFRIHVAVLKKSIKLKNKNNKHNPEKNPQKILDEIHRTVLKQQQVFNRTWKKIVQELNKKNVFLINDKHLTAKQKVFVRNFFDEELSSSIVPLLIENIPKLPCFGDNHIFLGIVMKKNTSHPDKKTSIIEIPTKNHSRFVFLPSPRGVQNIMLLEDVIRFNLPRIFSHLGYTRFDAHMFKVTRDAEIDLDHDISTTFIQKIEKGVKNRRKAQAIRFLYDKRMNRELLEILILKLNLSHRDSIIPGGHIRNFRDFMEFPAILPEAHPRPLPFKHPALTKSLRTCDVVMQQDVLLHTPYHSFNSIIDLLREAAMDPDVISIKITAYRLASHSKICNALINAVRNGKKVHVVLELRARFDEEANLEWKTKLEEEGVKVFIGIPNLKVHAKIGVIRKRIGHRIEHYGFVGTGNLNEKTALSYIDHFLLTSNSDIMADINRIFNALEKPCIGWKPPHLCKTLLISPIHIRKSLSSKINREIESAKTGLPAKIIVNINALIDEPIINKIYQAAEAGVEIKLIVRGIFCAAIDPKKIRQSITAISIVDEYLEHSRIWLFHNGGNEEIYLSSCDWRGRNLDHRIEVALPIKDKILKEELKHILDLKLRDNVKARSLDNKLSNHYVSSPGKKMRSQMAIYHYLKNKRINSYHENSNH